jgi:hypothetical protein
MKTFTFAAVTALAIALGAGPAAAATNLVINGGFETPAPTDGHFLIFGNGSHALTGWNVVGVSSNAVSLLNTDYVEPNVSFESQSGNTAMDISGGDRPNLATGINQTIATEIGRRYALTFWVGNADGSGNGNYSHDSILDLSIDGAAREHFTNGAITHHQVNWVEVTRVFTARSASTNIAFFNGTTADGFTGLDNVSVAAVPEPATWTMMIGGFGLAGAALRRRVRAANAA